MEFFINKQANKLLECSSCGEKLNPNQRYCSKCGKRVEVDETMKKKAISKLVLKNYSSIDVSDYLDFVSYKSITEKQKAQILNFDKNLSICDFICACSKSILGDSYKDGLLFMLSGFYVKETPFSQSYFFKYSDIELEILIGDSEELRVYFHDKETNKMKHKDVAIYDARKLKELLEKIIAIDKENDTSYTVKSPTGATKGVHGTKNRKAYRDGQISGYERCSRQYELKLRSEAEKFLKKEKDFRHETTEYEQLLDEYEKVIEELEALVRESSLTEYSERLENEKKIVKQLKQLRG
ncbi:zinc ribbon domain-containing protein [Treponema sp. Marseille-Q4132]|uniref:zinc ribbon domain-containing protein n=1 Tax=Treponema sp. Marseille-Q4132 TaxID=2766701 RepID=UPI001652D63A|nr:zinc ribbon domain-containing protein [Treponema sp. Marseille-Q4132]QNL96540.1 zinc ribbon domain-containing protein [Treponema sp. Marseille-Q4132]